MRKIEENPKAGMKPILMEDVAPKQTTLRWLRRVEKFYDRVMPSKTMANVKFVIKSSEDIETLKRMIQKAPDNAKRIKYLLMCQSIQDLYDIADFLTTVRKGLPDDVKIFFYNFSFLWVPLFKIVSVLGIIRSRPLGAFYFDADIECFCEMSGLEVVKRIRRFVLPFRIPLVSYFIEDFLFRLPMMDRLSIATFYFVRKSVFEVTPDLSTTVLIPCKNEQDNIEALVKRMPFFGRESELVFINDRSTDRTEEKILLMKKRYPDMNIKLVQGPGEGKGNAVRTGMNAASKDICMILDADMTVIPEDLPQFYEAMRARKADFMHGTRLVYPQESGAFRFANIVGNMCFSWMFSYILDQRTTDTLCGTKVYWRKDWTLFEECRKELSNIDLWGDYNLIFGASRFCLKIGQLPVRYFERLEGETKMNKRIRNGLIMLQVATRALFRIKFKK